MANQSTQPPTTPAPQKLTNNDLALLLNTLNPVASKCLALGLQLGLNDSQLRIIERDYRKCQDQLREIISERLRQESPLTWHDIARALRAESVGERRLASEVENKYINHLPPPASVALQVNTISLVTSSSQTSPLQSSLPSSQCDTCPLTSLSVNQTNTSPSLAHLSDSVASSSAIQCLPMCSQHVQSINPQCPLPSTSASTKKLQLREHYESDSEQMNVREGGMRKVGCSEVRKKRKRKRNHTSRSHSLTSSSIRSGITSSIPRKSSFRNIEKKGRGVPTPKAREQSSSSKGKRLHQRTKNSSSSELTSGSEEERKAHEHNESSSSSAENSALSCSPSSEYDESRHVFKKSRKSKPATWSAHKKRKPDFKSGRMKRKGRQLQLTSPLVNQFIDYVKTIYMESEVERNTEVVKWPPTPSKVFINLTCLDRESVSVKGGEYTKLAKAVVHDGNVDVINTQNGTMELSEIARGISIPSSKHSDTQASNEKRLILVEGAPGVGKSTFAKEFCRRWERGTVAQQYQLVLLLRLREDRICKAKSLKDLIYHPLEGVPQAVSEELLLSRNFHALIILEGFDELPDHCRSDQSIFVQLIAGTLLPLATVLVTSRPWATERILWNHGNRIYQHIKILGFTSCQISGYIWRTLPQEKASDLTAYLENHPQIRMGMYIPLNCAILVKVYLESQDSGCALPTTLTELYTAFVQTLLLRYLCSHPQYETTTTQAFNDLPPAVYTKFTEMCKLAYCSIVGTSGHVQLIFTGLPSNFDSLGFMDSVTELYVTQGAVSSHNFLHLTFQEYFAAAHISTLSPAEQLEHFRRHEDGRLKVVLRFLAGLNKLSCLSKTNVHHFLTHPQCRGSSPYSMPVDVGVTTDLVHWMFEAQSRDVITSVLEKTTINFTITEYMLPLDFYCLGYCIAHSQCQWVLSVIETQNNPLFRSQGPGIDILPLMRMPNMSMLAAGANTTEQPSGKVVRLMEGEQQPSGKVVQQRGEEQQPSGKVVQWRGEEQQPSGKVVQQRGEEQQPSGKMVQQRGEEQQPSGKVVQRRGEEQQPSGKVVQRRGEEQQPSGKVVQQRGEEQQPSGKMVQQRGEEQQPSPSGKVVQRKGGEHTIPVGVLELLSTEWKSVLHLHELALQQSVDRNITWPELSTLRVLSVDVRSGTRSKYFKYWRLDTLLPHLSLESLTLILNKNMYGYNEDVSVVFEDCVAIGNHITATTCLKELCFTYDEQYKPGEVVGIGDKGLEAITKGLVDNQSLSLERLELCLKCTFTDTAADCLVKFISNTTTLQYLTIWRCTFSAHRLLELARAIYGNSTLQEKNLKDSSCTVNGNDEANDLAQLLVEHPQVVGGHECIMMTQISDAGAVALAQALHHNSTLKVLPWSNYSIRDTGAEALAQALHHNSTLECLDLSDNSISGAGALALAHAFHHNSTLTLLNLYNNSIGDAGAVALAEGLQHNSTLKLLVLSNTSIGDAGAVALAKTLHHNSTLEWLDLSSNCISDDGTVALAQALHHHSTLKRLKLHYNNSSDAGAIALAQALRHNSILTHLHLSNNSISDAGAVALAQSLHHNSTLLLLELAYNSISNAGAEALAEAMHHNSTLKLLYLSNNCVGDAGAVALAQALHHHSTLLRLDVVAGSDGEVIRLLRLASN